MGLSMLSPSPSFGALAYSAPVSYSSNNYDAYYYTNYDTNWHPGYDANWDDPIYDAYDYSDMNLITLKSFSLVSTTTTNTLTTTTTTTTTITYRPWRISTVKGINKNGTQEEITECAGSLTLFSKTYLRGDKAILEDEEADLANISFDNLSVSAAVSGSCCWQIFSEQNYSGSNILLSSQGSYTSVSSLGSLFREVSSVRKHLC